MEGGLRTKGFFKTGQLDEPLVSIVTVVYNRKTYLEQAIKSVLNQQYKNIEYIIIDGGSTDGTLEIIKKYDDRLDYWLSEPDNGIYNAMNKGIKISSGELIGILNSDDYYPPFSLREIVNEYSLSDTDIIHGNMIFFTEYNDFCNFMNAKPDIEQMFFRPSIFHPTCFIKKTVYSEIGLFDETFQLIADYDFLLRAMEHNCEFHYIDKLIAVFRHGGASISGKGWNESIYLLKKHPGLKIGKGEIFKNILFIPLKKIVKKIIRYDSMFENKVRRQFFRN